MEDDKKQADSSVHINLKVKGQECLNGEFVRVGPNPRFAPVAGYHWFDGDGMIHGMRIKNGKATHVSRFVKTSRLKQEEFYGGAKFMKVHGLSETVVGVLGGGRLGCMLCEAASQLAIKVVILDPMENCPASNLCHYHMVGNYDDSATVEAFAKRCGVLTVEIEQFDAATLERLEQQGVNL